MRKGITKGTVVRTIMLAVVLANMVLTTAGKNPINVNESMLYEIIEMLVTIAVIIIGFWKNNSYTKNAQKADKYLAELKKFNEEED